MQVILDTNIIYSLMDKDDRQHLKIKSFFQENNDFLYILPSTTIIEICYLVRTRLSSYLEIKFLEEINQSFILEPVKDIDILRIIEILKKYNTLNIGYVDASIVAIAERLKLNKILTLDNKHFGVLAPRGFDYFDMLI
ncbi:MAG TPA: hypothetical protein DCP02_05100 [Actinobacteria bacterium]|nr:hypothetical protein [Actinomycetota bacterium]